MALSFVATNTSVPRATGKGSVPNTSSSTERALQLLRVKSHKVEVSGASHSVYVSRPKEVAALIAFCGEMEKGVSRWHSKR